MTMAELDRMRIATKLRDMVTKLHDIIEYSRVSNDIEHCIHSASGYLSSAAKKLGEDSTVYMDRCNNCGYLGQKGVRCVSCS